MARRKAKGKGKRRKGRAAAFAISVLVVGALLVVGAFELRVRQFLTLRSIELVRVYSAPFALRPGIDPDRAGVRSRLARLGYREIREAPDSPGEFRWRGGVVEIGLRGFHDPRGEIPARRVRLDLGPEGTIRRVTPRDVDARLEPELVGSYGGSLLDEHRPIRLDELPDHVVHAVLAIEDARFPHHHGIDPIAVIRAAVVNLRSGSIRQGGSTVTQQLAKNVFLDAERRWGRKLREAIYALLLELHLSKREIFELYVNTVYLGRVGSVGLYGLGSAAQAFFAKEARELDVAEAAVLAGLIRAPNRYSPLRHPERARARRAEVLATMEEYGWIDPAEAEAARRAAITTAKRVPRGDEAAFFVDEVLRRLERLGYPPTRVRGLSVYTTLDLETQRLAEAAVREGVAFLEERYPRLRGRQTPLEGAAVLLEAGTGQVRAVVGGRDFGKSQFNRATRARRQPGSAFKPFVYLAALDDPGQAVTPVTLLLDEPLEIRSGGRAWSPTNYDGEFLGEVTVREALETSRNVPTVRLALKTGLPKIADLADRVGLGPVEATPALALGAYEVSLVDLAGAYTVFPNLGRVVRPALFRAVIAEDGRVLYADEMRAPRVATEAAAYVTSHLLEGVVDRGTGRAVRRSGILRPLGGKTGTSNEERDAWFVGYSPDWVAAVWVGFDGGESMGLTGAGAALPIWTRLMAPVLEFSTSRALAAPPGVIFREVDPETGLLASWGCRGVPRPEPFVLGSEPRRACDGRLVPAGNRPRGWRPLEEWFRRWPGATG